MTFHGFPKLPGVSVVPNELLDLHVDPYTWAVIMYFASRTYRHGEEFVQATKKEIEDATGIGETKLREVLNKMVEDGYLKCVVSSSHAGNIYALSFGYDSPTATIDEPKSESFKDWLVSRVVSMVNDAMATDKNGKPLQIHQRRLRAGLWAWHMIFGKNTPCDPKTMVEMIAVLGGSPAKVAKFLLRYAESEPWEGDEKADQKMLAILKAKLKKFGAAGEKRKGLGDEENRQLPIGRQAFIPS